MIISGNTSQNFINNNTGITKKEVARENKDTVTFGSTNSTPDFMALKELASRTAKEVARENKDTVTFGGTNSTPDFMALKELASQTAGISGKGTFAAIGGAVGGAIGLATGAVYSATVLIPLLVAAGNIPESASAGDFGQEFVKQMTSPLRWAIGGAKAGANAVLNSF